MSINSVVHFRRIVTFIDLVCGSVRIVYSRNSIMAAFAADVPVITNQVMMYCLHHEYKKR